jgi:hypothetical protein
MHVDVWLGMSLNTDYPWQLLVQVRVHVPSAAVSWRGFTALFSSVPHKLVYCGSQYTRGSHGSRGGGGGNKCLWGGGVQRGRMQMDVSVA